MVWLVRIRYASSIVEGTLFDAIGGIPTLERVHKSFYDKVFAHPWIGQFFVGTKQPLIERRQTLFMAEKMGGEIRYPGRPLEIAHRRMFITQELLEVRQQLLRESIEQAGLAVDLVRRWLRIDKAFWVQLKNLSLEEFQTIDLKFERPLIVERPD
jgi:hemoglobin